jgi:hypothetical protein
MPDATWPDFAQHLKNRLDTLEAALGTTSLLNVGTSAGEIPVRQQGGAINFPIDTQSTTQTLTAGTLFYGSDGHMYFSDGEALIQLAEV